MFAELGKAMRECSLASRKLDIRDVNEPEMEEPVETDPRF